MYSKVVVPIYPWSFKVKEDPKSMSLMLMNDYVV